MLGVLFTTTTRKLTSSEIEKKPQIQVLVNAGANVLFASRRQAIIDENLLKVVDGILCPIGVKEGDEQKYLFYGETNNALLNNWKNFSYKEYLDYIDYDEIERIQDIYNIRESNPLNYYERMIQREKI